MYTQPPTYLGAQIDQTAHLEREDLCKTKEAYTTLKVINLHCDSTSSHAVLLCNMYMITHNPAINSTIMLTARTHLCHSQKVGSEGLASPQQCQEAAYGRLESEPRDGHFDDI